MVKVIISRKTCKTQNIQGLCLPCFEDVQWAKFESFVGLFWSPSLLFDNSDVNSFFCGHPNKSFGLS